MNEFRLRTKKTDFLLYSTVLFLGIRKGDHTQNEKFECITVMIAQYVR